MNLILRRVAVIILGISVWINVQAEPEAIRKAFAKAMPGSVIDAISESPVSGIYEVAIGPTIFYVSADGRYLINGSLYDLQAPAESRDLTEPKISAARVRTIEKIGPDKVIEFKSPMQKQTVSIFTDVDCGYCRKLHSEIDNYLANGITVRYLFFPRAGIGSESYRKAVAVWCSDDRQQALTLVKQGKTIDMQTCDNPVSDHMQLANEFKIRGTPMIVTQAGNVMPGYLSAEDLSKALGLTSN